MTGTYKTRLIFQRKSNRIVIREPSRHESWDRYECLLSMEQTIQSMEEHIEKAIKQIKKICPYQINISNIDLHTQEKIHQWCEECATDRFAATSPVSVYFTLNKNENFFFFKSKDDAMFFMLTWGGELV